MNTVETESLSSPRSAVSAPPVRRARHPRERRRRILPTIVATLLLAGACGGAVYASIVGVDKASREGAWALKAIRSYLFGSSSVAKPKDIKPRRPWDGLVGVDPVEANNAGLLVVAVRPQTEPIKLELPGRTAYDPNSLNKIRPRFDTLVEKVHVELGQKVKKGQPLLDLFSTDLAAAKNDFQTAYVQWQHDLTFRMHRESLFKTGAISEQLLIDTRNDENKSRLAVTTARQKLKIFEVPLDQIDVLTKNLNPADIPEKDAILDFMDKAKMTRISPVDGIVVQRDVVPGNLYDTADVLLVIAPLEHLIVWLNLYETDLAKVSIGQTVDIKFPYLNRTVLATVQYVATEVSKDTRAIKIRAFVPNDNGELKADMLVRATLDIPPVAGQTVVPRAAVVVMNGREYAFVRKSPSNDQSLQLFERRQLEIVEERFDEVVVATGATAGEEVVSRGSLILAQLYEDQQMVATGMPLE
jgi:membrane fusion protein, heavy metal efflux system